MMVRDACPGCGSQQYKKNGHIHNGKQNYRCTVCGQAFVLQPANKLLSKEQRALIDKLLLEKLSLRGICRVVGITLKWLLTRRFDLRRSRYIGLARTHLQQLLTATAMNIVRVIAWRWGELLGERRRQPGHLARLAPHPLSRQTVLC
jgi:transposase-like protein